jgi:hypothetical protein
MLVGGVLLLDDSCSVRMVLHAMHISELLEMSSSTAAVIGMGLSHAQCARSAGVTNEDAMAGPRLSAALLSVTKTTTCS